MNDFQISIDRPPPHSELIERTVLGALLYDARTWQQYGAAVRPEYFYTTIIRLILCYMHKMNCCDPYILCEKFPDDAVLILECRDHTCAGTTLQAELDILVDRYQRREQIRAAQSLIEASHDDFERTTTQMRDDLQANFANLLGHTERRIVTPRDVLPAIFDQLERAQKGEIAGLLTGLNDLDKIVGGMLGGDLIIIAARPSMGKTAFALSIVRENAIRKNIPIMVFSLEMSAQTSTARMLFAEAELNLDEALRGVMKRDDYIKLQNKVTPLSEAPIFLDDTPAANILHITNKARQYHQSHNIGLVIVDHIQLMGVVQRGRSRNEEVAEFSAGLKNLARDLNIPIIGISQLSREVEKRQDKRPIMSDLRDSGSLEQDAQRIIFLYRDEYYKKDSDQKGICEIRCEKNTNGSIGIIKAVFDKQTMNFRDKADDFNSPPPPTEHYASNY